MQNSNLVLLFRQLDKKDLRDLSKFVRSPFFNQRSDVIALFDYLVEHAQQSSDVLDKKVVFSYIFPNQCYQDSLMRYAMSFLYKSVKRYLSIQQLEADGLQTQIYHCRAFRQRGLEKLFFRELNRSEQLQEEQPFRHAQYHFQNYQLNLERYGQTIVSRRQGEMNLQQLSDELSTFYIADILRHSCIMLTHQKMSPQSYQFQLLDAILAHVAMGHYEEVPAVALYYHSYLTLTSEEHETHFHLLKQLMDRYWTVFPPVDIRDIFLLAINYCIRRLNSGSSKYIREAFNLYLSGLDKAVLLENGLLSRFTYNNVLLLGLALGEFDWGKDFLERFKSQLAARERDNIYRYNLAVYYFRLPDYDQVMELLQGVEFKDLLYNLDARRMLLRIYYELEEFDALESLLDSFRRYIQRQKDIGYHRDNYLNLIRFTRRLLSSHLDQSDEVQQVRQAIAETKALAEREWLLAQLKGS